MQFRRFGNKYFVRIDRGEEIINENSGVTK